MPLFPAYASSDTLDIESDGETVVASSASAGTASPALEARLLASDDDGDADSAAAPRPAKRPSPTDDSDFYLDTKFDGANLPVTTLYYPGRPQYDLTCAWKVLGLDKSKGRRISRGKRKRYYSGEVPSDAAAVAAEVAARAQALRRALADDPADQPLWLRYIAFQERWAGGEAALRAADEAEAAAGAGAAGVRAAVLRVRARHLPRADYCAALRRRIAAEREPLALWVRLVRAAGGGGGGDGGEGAAALAARALRRLRHSPPAYPHLLYAYGCWARDAGLWELLTLLVELVLSVCLGADARLPPPPQERLDACLQAAEDKIIESGLPMHVVWARVERARAEAHWHRAGAGAPAELDPQRAPHPADVADLLLPVADPDAALLLCAQLLRLAKVPLLPACGASARAAAPCADEPGGGEALLPLVAAARRLPAAHPARCGGAALAARALARFVDPPHYFSDDNGYRRWVDALWDACCERTRGERRTALLCWRMRWWHALLLLVSDEAEARRVLADARAALKRFEDASPLPFALFARVQLAAGAGAERARGVAVRALRSALADARCPPPHRLHVARVVGEADRADGPWGKWATACAALGRPLPPDAELEAPPPEELTQAALDECRRRCAQLERRFEAEAEAEAEADGAAPPLHEALLPGAGEWPSALVRLAAPAAPSPLPPPARLAALVTQASAEAAGYWEQAACAWAVRAARAQRQARVAHALAPLFPRNAFLALAAGGAPPWAWRRPPDGVAGAPESPEAALAALLPRLLRAERARWAPAEAGRVATACAAACAGGGGPLAWCVRLEAEGRGGGAGGGTRAALLGAAEAQPHHKWALARGAALCPAEAAALPDLLLERHLRLHALPDELRLPTATATPL